MRQYRQLTSEERFILSHLRKQGAISQRLPVSLVVIEAQSQERLRAIAVNILMGITAPVRRTEEQWHAEGDLAGIASFLILTLLSFGHCWGSCIALNKLADT